MQKVATLLSAAVLIVFCISFPARSQDRPEEKIIIKLESSPSETGSSAMYDSGAPGVGLALSGGGSRALAHIGVLKALVREGIDIKIIAGVSMGAVVGGLYSSGYSPEEIEETALSVDWQTLFSQSPLRRSLLITQKDHAEKSLVKIRFNKWRPVLPKAISSGQNLRQYLESVSARSGIRPSISFDYLSPPLRIICTDLSSGQRVVIGSGSLAEAMRASTAVPVAFTPVEIDGRLLVDGGLVDPIPVDIVRGNFSGPVIAVDVSSQLLPVSRIANVIDIADQTTTIMSMRKKEESLREADLVISPDLGGRISTDFSHIEYLIEAGEEAAMEVIPDIKALFYEEKQGTDDDSLYLIEEMRIKGLSSMPVTVFKSVFSNSRRMSRSSIESNLRKALRSGFLADCRAELVPSDSGYLLEYYLADNPRVGRIKVEGATLFKDVNFKALIRTRAGMILKNDMVQSDRKTIEDYYIESGCSLVRVSSAFEQATRTLVFRIDEGRINRILVEGNNRTRDWAIRRHVPFRAGDIYRQKKASVGVEDLYGTGLFETARFAAVPDSVGVTLKAIVTEKPYQYIRGGARFDLEYGSRAFVDLVDDNIFGAGLVLYVSTIMGEKRRSVSLNFKADRIWNTLYTYHLLFDYGEFKQNHYQDHEYRRTFRQFHHGGELSLGRQIPRLGTISVTGQIRRYMWDEPGKAERQLFDKISIGFRSIVDTRDAIDFPETGKYHFFDLEFTGDISDDKTAYTRFLTSLESYYRLSGRVNFHPKISLGASSNFMPYFDKFSLGGSRRFSGLYEDEIVGEKLLTGELELRYRAFGFLYFAGRYDFGNIWNKLESFRFSELRHSGGLGLELKTPLGPVSVWYGRTSEGLDAYYFSAGYDW